jgi:RNA polymerase sigma-70 factor, ECF subfamily
MHATLREDIEKLTPALRRFARALVAHEPDESPELADALVQEALARAWRADWSRRLVNPRTFLYSAVTGANRQRLRSRQTAHAAGDSAAPRPAGGTAQAASEGRTNPARFFVHDRPGGITGALDTLGLDEREAYLLVVLEGLSYADAGEVIGIPRSVLLARLVKAHQGLDQSLEPVAPSDQRGRRAPHLRLVK